MNPCKLPQGYPKQMQTCEDKKQNNNNKSKQKHHLEIVSNKLLGEGEAAYVLLLNHFYECTVLALDSVVVHKQ